MHHAPCTLPGAPVDNDLLSEVLATLHRAWSAGVAGRQRYNLRNTSDPPRSLFMRNKYEMTQSQFAKIHRFLLLAVVAGFACVTCVAPIGAQSDSDQTVVLQTTKGRIVIRVFFSLVPYTAGRFLQLVDRGFYNGLSFHRVEDSLIQGGDPNGNGTGNYIDPNTGAPQFLKLQCHPALSHNQGGMVAMARGNNPNSASCQFYIIKRAMPQLNGRYAVFGRVIDGASVVMRMRPGDRILSASVYDDESASSSSRPASDEAVPGAVPGVPAPAASGSTPTPATPHSGQPEESSQSLEARFRRFKKPNDGTAAPAQEQQKPPEKPRVNESGF